MTAHEADKAITEIQEELGWTDAVMTNILWQYVLGRGSASYLDDLVAHFRKVAQSERERKETP